MREFMNKFFRAFIFLLCLFSSASLIAAEFTLTPVVKAAYDPLSGDQIVPTPFYGHSYYSPIIYEVQIRMDVVSLNLGERGFGSVRFDVNFGGGTGIDPNFGGWATDTRNGDSNGAAAGGSVPLWFSNIDGGSNPDDLQGIFVSIAPGLTGANDNRRNIGQVPGSQGVITGTNPYPTGELGSIFVWWDGYGINCLPPEEIQRNGLPATAAQEAKFLNLSKNQLADSTNQGHAGQATYSQN